MIDAPGRQSRTKPCLISPETRLDGPGAHFLRRVIILGIMAVVALAIVALQLR